MFKKVEKENNRILNKSLVFGQNKSRQGGLANFFLNVHLKFLFTQIRCQILTQALKMSAKLSDLNQLRQSSVHFLIN